MADTRITLENILFNLENEYRRQKHLTPYATLAEFSEVPFTHRKWEIIPGVYAVQRVFMDQNKKLAAKDESIAVKLIVNKDTMEIRQFVSKFTDEVETLELPG